MRGRSRAAIAGAVVVAVAAAGLLAGAWIGERGNVETADADADVPDGTATVPGEDDGEDEDVAHDTSDADTDDPNVPEGPEVGPTPQRTREFEQALTGGDAGAVLDTVLLGPDDDPQTVADEALPDGAQLQLDETTFEPAGEDTAMLEGRIDTDEQTYTLTFLLHYTDERWWLAGSDEPQPLS